MTWGAPDLRGRVAVVTGASRGVGRGIALVLGECGATVYVTGRSTRAHAREGAPGTVDDTADEVTAGPAPRAPRRGGARPPPAPPPPRGAPPAAAAASRSRPTTPTTRRPPPSSPA